MSTFKALTKHPVTGKYEVATWHDNFYGLHHYGVQFPDGYMGDPRFEEVPIAQDVEINDYKDDE